MIQLLWVEFSARPVLLVVTQSTLRQEAVPVCRRTIEDRAQNECVLIFPKRGLFLFKNGFTDHDVLDFVHRQPTFNDEFLIAILVFCQQEFEFSTTAETWFVIILS